MLFSGSSAFAGGASIEGIIIGPNGTALAGSEIRAQRVDVKAAPLQTKSDSKGRYAFSNIAPGNYAVTTAVKGVAASATTVKTTGRTRFDVDLRKDRGGKTAAAKPAPTPQNPGAADVNRMQRSLGGSINGMTFPGH